ncbi:putative TIM-barrel fold metal-dependent hydrolase [Paenibacillus sp. V4I3]|uniref:amidohydrolase family protein n=1 Tax=unclassified Paenibacillus TaxID=185978 RepID=UPI00278243EE|nr:MULTISPECIES: amidohydrolase family protein [unclassified Paenibacillus]MDQ0874763.1 putative TIM-barrel fold metal-dependent hydrolase [Paenibacillus sp. V4I3]MDQ0889485.1 putative TIM-barrel fold metal-dependent hydrolase [Paenibacillus sp. V4I9]
MSILHDYVNRIRIIDGHEHLATPQIRKREDHDLFSLLHYLDSDFYSAGMKMGALGRQSSLDVEQKATLFMDFWHKTKNTTYARMFRTAMEDLYELNEWNVNGLLEANVKVSQATHNPNWYEHVMAQKSGIDLAFTLIQTTKLAYVRFRPIMFMDFTFKLRTLKDITTVERMSGVTVYHLRQYLEAVDTLLHKYVQEGMVATKFGHAYWRSLSCGKPTLHEAELAFNRLLGCTLEESLSQAETQALQDYLIHFIIQRSIAYDLPIQIHTGHHEVSVSSNGNSLTNSNVELLIPLLLEYTEARFVLLHSGYPYYLPYLSIVKNFPNVYADFTWVYIISPTAAKQILHQVIEMVPMTKIQGFGGDYNYIEGTYAHQKLARKVVADVLTEKVADGALDESDAMTFADRIFRTNLIELYKLKGLEE